MKENNFIPILFGSDRNVYGMAVGFYEEYKVRSIAVCKIGYSETKYSKLIDIYVNKDIEKKEVFFNVLKELKDKYNNKKLILIACSDVYARLIIENKTTLEKDFIVPYIDEKLMNKLIIKENFYKICEEYNLDYPKTFICTKKDYKNIKIPFSFPIILKPSDSVSYWKSHFAGKKKIFIINNINDFKNTLENIYNSEYEGDLIIQEYIEGDDTHLRVLNAYVDTNHKVTFMALGQIILEDKSPSSYGDYDAIIPTYDQELFDKVKYFLEKIKYTGYANFDFKYNDKTNSYKIFEINIRQGRSHSFTTLGGKNITKYLVEDVIYHKERNIEYLDNEYLWTIIPKNILLKYIKNNDIKNKVKKLYKEKKVKNILFYKKDLNIKRFLKLIRKNFDKKYKLYYK